MISKLRNVFLKYTSLEGCLFRYSLSFCMLLALLPTLVVILLLFQNSILDVSLLTQVLYRYLPADLLQPFLSYILQKEIALYRLVFTFIPILYLASRSFYSFLLISAMHENFKTKKVLLKIKAFVLFLYFIAGIVCIFICMKLTIFNKTFVSIGGLFLSLYILYRALSFEKRCMYYGSVGALFSCSGIIGVGTLFFYVIENFTSYTNVYGPLGSFVILLLSIYIISSIIYFGYCLNLEFVRKVPIKKYKALWFYRNGEKLITLLKKHITKL